MSEVQEVKDNVVEGEFTEIESPQEGTDDGVKVAAQVTISVMSDGQLNLNVNENYQKLESAQVEGIVKSVYEQLHDQRIASAALELLKARLG